MEGYQPNHIEDIKRRVPVVDIIGRRVALKKSGKNYRGLCPFHGEKSPSFFVFPDTESYYCFGCQATGDIFRFTMQTEGLTFGQALEELAARAGIQLPQRNAAEESESLARRQERDRLREVNAAAATYFQNLLHNSKESEVARQYLQKRGVTKDSVDLFGIGYSLEKWDGIVTYLTGRGFTTAEMATAGVVIAREEGKGYVDRFRGRLMFPIRDRQGQIIAFGGRVLENAPKDAPKYLNSPQTPLFDKSATLYGLDLAKEAIRKADATVVVEGYLDVIMAHQHGFSNVVAPLGTALNEKHIELVKKLSRRLILALDADRAGQMATLKGIETARQGFDHITVPVPNARAYIRFEQHLNADIRIARLPVGKDPDEVVRMGGGLWQQTIERAMPVVDFYFSTVIATVDLNSAKGKSAAVETLLPVIMDVTNRIEREHYLAKLSRLTGITSDTLFSELKKVQKQRLQTPLVSPEVAIAGDIPVVDDSDEAAAEKLKMVAVAAPTRKDEEDGLLAYIIRYRSDVLEVPASDGEYVKPTDFKKSENRLIFEELLRIEKERKPNEELETVLHPQLQGWYEELSAYGQSEPLLDTLLLSQQGMQRRLDFVRDRRLQDLQTELYHAQLELEAVTADEPPDSSSEPTDNLTEPAEPDQLWRLASETAARRKFYYPKPSVVFKDIRDR